MVQHRTVDPERRNMREAANWRNNRPSREELIKTDPDRSEECRTHFASLDIPGTPGVEWSQDLKVMGLPHLCGDREVLDVYIAHGQTGRGAGHLRSDDHVSRFKIEVPAYDVDWDDLDCDDPTEEAFIDNKGWRDTCPECGHDRVVYSYRANHHICGSQAVFCAECEHTLFEEEWA